MAIDRFGRNIHYLRVSLTDKCNLRCVYCMAEDMTFRPNAEQTLKSYYQVPAEIIEDTDELRQWAVQATECQRRNRKT